MTDTTTCARCAQPATERVILRSARAHALLLDELLCADHADMERRMVGLSIATAEFLPLASIDGPAV